MCFFSCNNGQQLKRIEFQELEPIIESYLSENRQFKQLSALNSNEKYPVPSYHLYLYKWKKDTMVSIVQNLFLTASHILGKESNDSTIFYADVTPKGLIEYKKSPIILFDPDSLLNQSTLPSITEVPNRYKFQGENIHRKRNIWDFVLRNGEFERDDREMHLIKPDPK